MSSILQGVSVDAAEQIEAVGRFMASVNKRDFPAATALLTDDVRLVEPTLMPYAGTYVGHEQFVALMSEVAQTWESWRDAPYPYQLASVGNRVFKEATARAVHRETRAVVDMHFLEVLEFRGDKIANIRPYFFDPAKIAAAIRDASLAAG
jgi:ketosteroid isomerase-like protein